MIIFYDTGAAIKIFDFAVSIIITRAAIMSKLARRTPQNIDYNLAQINKNRPVRYPIMSALLDFQLTSSNIIVNYLGHKYTHKYEEEPGACELGNYNWNKSYFTCKKLVLRFNNITFTFTAGIKCIDHKMYAYMMARPNETRELCARFNVDVMDYLYYVMQDYHQVDDVLKMIINLRFMGGYAHDIDMALVAETPQCEQVFRIYLDELYKHYKADHYNQKFLRELKDLADRFDSADIINAFLLIHNTGNPQFLKLAHILISRAKIVL